MDRLKLRFALHQEVWVLFSERARRPPPRGRIDQGIPTVPLESPSDPEFPRHEQNKNNEIAPQILPYRQDTTDI